MFDDSTAISQVRKLHKNEKKRNNKKDLLVNSDNDFLLDHVEEQNEHYKDKKKIATNNFNIVLVIRQIISKDTFSTCFVCSLVKEIVFMCTCQKSTDINKPKYFKQTKHETNRFHKEEVSIATTFSKN